MWGRISIKELSTSSIELKENLSNSNKSEIKRIYKFITWRISQNWDQKFYFEILHKKFKFENVISISRQFS